MRRLFFSSMTREPPTESATSSLYYSAFEGKTFVIQAEADAIDDRKTTLAILGEIRNLLQHDIRAVLVFGKGDRFEKHLQSEYAIRSHPETNRTIIPERALARIQQERMRVGQEISRLCGRLDIPSADVPASVVRAERRLGHESTGVVTGIDTALIRKILEHRRLAIIGFGGEDERRQFLHVPSVPLSADVAANLAAQKLLLLNHGGGIFVPASRGNKIPLSFADLDELLCLLQRTDQEGKPVLSGSMIPKVHAGIRAIAGGVSQVHIVSHQRMLEEILTRTGVGTMIELYQGHHVDFAAEGDIEAVEKLHTEAQRYSTEHGTPFVKPLDHAALVTLLPNTLLLKHRGVVVGKLHATKIPGRDDALLIGGFVIGENHQDSQHGQVLLSEALARFRGKQYAGAVAITASDRAKKLFGRVGKKPDTLQSWQEELLATSRKRYHSAEQNEVTLFEFTLAKPE